MYVTQGITNDEPVKLTRLFRSFNSFSHSLFSSLLNREKYTETSPDQINNSQNVLIYLYDFNIVLRVKLWETLEFFSRFVRRFPTLTGTKTDEYI